MTVKLENSWKTILNDQFELPYFKKIKNFLIEEKKHFVVYPPSAEIFAALDSCPVDKVKVVILGQDPYYNPRQANGLAFSVSKEVPVPKSLINIYKELHEDLNISIPSHGCLSSWASQGVLLLNASLTVRAFTPASHAGIGWQTFTDVIIQRLSAVKENLVFLLWGAYAQKKEELIAKNKGHFILKAAHPSPLSAHKGFFGCKHFSKTNAFLRSKGLKEIDWQV